jgi:quercetin dioxygenase-like cupin family protein
MEPNSGRVIRASEAPSFEHTPGGYVRFFSGDQHEFGSLTVATSSNPSGGGVPEHRHPCTELFVVVEGPGVYTLDGVDMIADAGDVVFVPANTSHSFRAAGEDPLRHVAVFPNSHLDTELRGT